MQPLFTELKKFKKSKIDKIFQILSLRTLTLYKQTVLRIMQTHVHAANAV